MRILELEIKHFLVLNPHLRLWHIWRKIVKSRILEQYEKMDDFEKITFDKLVKRCGKLYGEKLRLKI